MDREGVIAMVAQVRNADTGVRRLVASEVTEVLGRQSGLAKEAVANTAQIVAAVAAAVIGLPAAQQKRLKGKSADVATMIAAFAREKRPATATGIPAPARTKARNGSGFGGLVEYGRASCRERVWRYV